MIRQFLSLVMVSFMLVFAWADQPSRELPDGIKNFNGMLVGRLVSKDPEKGTFQVQVDAVPRVWENNKAKDPKSIVGKTVEVTGVFGKFLDVLVVTRAGETVEFECKHDGDVLRFPGEMLRKVAPYDVSDYPELPEGFRGFKGAVIGEVVKKDPESLELILNVQKVSEVWDDNAARQPRSIEGKPIMLAGFWNRREEYHGLKVGDRIELGLQHVALRSDHVNIAKFVRQASSGETDGAKMKPESSPAVTDGLTPALRGFRGMLVGRLTEKDVERGTFTVVVDAVPRVWKNNEAAKPKDFIGRHAVAEGIHGKLLDVLVVTRPGETIEFGAMHDGGENLRVLEGLRKVAPVEPGDYPELPDAFRGFKGILVGKVIEKEDTALELIVQVSQVEKSLGESKSTNAESIVGKPIMLAGFWQRKDNFHSLHVGDTIRFGVEHPQLLSDHLSVIEVCEKVEKE